jgi:hypothetical protein
MNDGEYSTVCVNFWDREREDQPEGVDRQRVGHQPLELERLQEPFEVRQADPRAAREPVDRVVVAERDLRAVHRPVLEDQDVGDRRSE